MWKNNSIFKGLIFVALFGICIVASVFDSFMLSVPVE